MSAAPLQRPNLHLGLELAEAVADRCRPHPRRRVALQHAQLLGHARGSGLHCAGAADRRRERTQNERWVLSKLHGLRDAG